MSSVPDPPSSMTLKGGAPAGTPPDLNDLRTPASPAGLDDLLSRAAHLWIDAYGTGAEPYSTTFNRFLWAAEHIWFDASASRYTPAEEPELLEPERPARSGRSTAPRRREECHLYRLWGPDGRLVYIGVTRCLKARLKAHRKRWDEKVWGWATWAEYPDAASMLAAERRAIADEAPPLNIAGVQ